MYFFICLNYHIATSFLRHHFTLLCKWLIPSFPFKMKTITKIKQYYSLMPFSTFTKRKVQSIKVMFHFLVVLSFISVFGGKSFLICILCFESKPNFSRVCMCVCVCFNCSLLCDTCRSSFLGLLFAQLHFKFHKFIRKIVLLRKAEVMSVLCLRIHNIERKQGKIWAWRLRQVSAV